MQEFKFIESVIDRIAQLPLLSHSQAWGTVNRLKSMVVIIRYTRIKQPIAQIITALLLTAAVTLTAPQAHAQNPLPGQGAPAGAGQMSAADQQEFAAFAKKAQVIQLKYKPQFEAIQKKYQPQITAIKNKYKPKMDALQKEGQALKPEDQKGPKGQALIKKMMDLQNQMKAEPGAKKFNGEVRPIAQKCNGEILAITPAKFKPQVKATLDGQMKQLGG
ncbi:MAG: hypothetical protein JWN14_4835 [Chthonomonadales bacterium]|nr:hypothetical protein [Chthonomonadales bacterium]